MTLATRSSLFAAFAGILMSASVIAHAEIQFPIEKPNPAIGDVWKHRTTDLWTGNVQSTSEVELVGIEADRFVMLVKGSAIPAPRTDKITKDLGRCSKFKASEEIICGGQLSFPIQIGKKSEYDRLPYSNGDGYFDEKCEPKSEEKVTVPAGTFDAVRIECSGYWTNTSTSNAHGTFKQTLWYSPKVNRIIKTDYSDRYEGQQLNRKTLTELTEFSAKK